jgi:hypothetical protein
MRDELRTAAGAEFRMHGQKQESYQERVTFYLYAANEFARIGVE